MFQLFKEKKNHELSAVVDGVCIPIEKVNDPTFANKTLGDGVAIIPESNVIVAPCDGTITIIAPTLHAFGMACEDGLELLIHVGIDTVDLNGKGFKLLAEAGSKVKKGQVVIEFDVDYMKDKGVDMITMLIILNGSDFSIKKRQQEKQVKKGIDVVLEYSM